MLRARFLLAAPVAVAALLGCLAVPARAQVQPEAPAPPDEATLEELSPPPKLLLRGFGNLDYRYEDGDLPNTFVLGQLDLFMTSELSDNLSVLAEIVFEGKEGREERIIDVERYQIKYSPRDAFSVALGRMHTVLGYWNQTYHHGTWFQTTAFRPDVYRFEDEGGLLPIHEVGLRVFGVQSLAGLRLHYAASVANGRAADSHEVTTVQDANDHKAVNLWLGVSPKAAPGLQFGAVFHDDRIPPDPSRPDRDHELDERILGGFVAYQRAPIEILSEAFRIRHKDRLTAEVFETTGLYVQGAYAFGRFKPYYRFDRVKGAAADPYYPDYPARFEQAYARPQDRPREPAHPEARPQSRPSGLRGGHQRGRRPGGCHVLMRRLGLTLAGLLVAFSASSADASAAEMAVIVHPSNPQTEVSSADLVQILKMERQHWPAGGRIYVVLQESGTVEKELVLKKLYRMKDAELKQHYLGKLYRGEIASFPRIAHSNSAARRLVSQAPNAISFIDAASADATVRVLRVDGKRPGEPGYVLGTRPEVPEAVSNR